MAEQHAAGWGAAYWPPSGILLGTARGFLGTAVSNNVAEYCGLKEGMLHALDIASPSDTVVFEVDSSHELTSVLLNVAVSGPLSALRSATGRAFHSIVATWPSHFQTVRL